MTPDGLSYPIVLFSVSLLNRATMSETLFFVSLFPGIPGILLFAAYLSARFLLRKPRPRLRVLYVASASVLHVSGFLSAVFFALAEEAAPAWGAAVFFILYACFAVLYVENNTTFTWISVLAMQAVSLSIFRKLDYKVDSLPYIAGMVGAFAAFAFAGRFLHNKIIVSFQGDEGKRKHGIDWFTLLDVAYPIVLLCGAGRYGRFAGSILLVVYALAVYGRIDGKLGQRNAKDLVLTAAAASVCLAAWLQPFFAVPGFLKTEGILLTVSAFAIFLNRTVWPAVQRATGYLLVAVSALGILVLAADAVRTGKAADAYSFGIVSVILAAAAVFRKRGEDRTGIRQRHSPRGRIP